MTRGREYAADIRRLARWRVVWLVAGVVGVLLFAFVVVGTASSVLDPGYRFADGELVAEFGLLAGFAGLVVLTVFRIRAGDRRTGAVLGQAGTGPWLPPAGEDAGPGVDLDAETRRLGVLALRAAGLALLWCGVLTGAITGLGLRDQAADGLLATGARTAGEVESVLDPRNGAPSMWVHYEVDGRSRTAEIVRDTGHGYQPGDRVTVVYDRADPTYVRTVEEPNHNQYLTGFLVVPLLFSLVGVPWSLVAAGGWWRRHSAVRHTGWRVAAVTVAPDYPVRKGRHLPDIQVRYADESRMVLRAVASTHGATMFKNRPYLEVRVGGWDRGMVVLFPHGRLRQRPYAVPAYALSQRRRIR